MVKHIQKNLPQIANNLSVFEQFMGLALKGFNWSTPDQLYCFGLMQFYPISANLVSFTLVLLDEMDPVLHLSNNLEVNEKNSQKMQC